MSGANKLTKKINRRNAVIFVSIVIIIILLLFRKKIADRIFDRRQLPTIPGQGDFSWQLGDLNIPGISIPDLSVYDQQSSCGCSLATIEINGGGPVYYAPASVKGITHTTVQHHTMYVAPPPPPPPPKPKKWHSAAY